MRMINKSGIELIKSFEGLRIKAYRCSAGKWTIGYGHTKGVYNGQEITEEHAEAFLIDDLHDAQMAVSSLVEVHLNDNEYAALISFVFNIGCGAFKGSTLLKLLNKRMYDMVPAQLMRWNKVNGEENGGLSRRRKAECQLWNKPVTIEV